MTEGNGAGLYWVGGSKGGLGKSMMTVAMLDYLIEQRSNAVLVECDTSNPNVWKAHREQVVAELINLDEAYGWIHVVNTFDRPPRGGRGDQQHRGAQQRCGQAVRRHARQQPGGVRDRARGDVGDQPAARQPGALARVGAVPKAAVHVERNGFFGDEKKFELYNGAKVREEVEGRGGKSITLPDLADRVADDIYSRRTIAVWRRRSSPSATEQRSGDGAARSARSSPESCRERRGHVR